jgi:TonB family protein
MKLCRPASLVVALAFCFLPAAPAQVKDSPEQPDTAPKSAPALKLLKAPMAPFPEEALRKNIVGKVDLSLVVDAQGHVSDAKIVSGPPELYQAALDSVKQWQFEPPAHVPAETKASVAFGHPNPCPAQVATIGTIIPDSWLTNDKGTGVEVLDDPNWKSPHYYFEDMRAGAAGIMVLSVTVNAKGKITRVEVVHSLSPHLDKATINTVRTWRFKLRDGSPGSLPDTFPLHIKFEPDCDMDL